MSLPPDGDLGGLVATLSEELSEMFYGRSSLKIVRIGTGTEEYIAPIAIKASTDALSEVARCWGFRFKQSPLYVRFVPRFKCRSGFYLKSVVPFRKDLSRHVGVNGGINSAIRNIYPSRHVNLSSR